MTSGWQTQLGPHGSSWATISTEPGYFRTSPVSVGVDFRPVAQHFGDSQLTCGGVVGANGSERRRVVSTGGVSGCMALLQRIPERRS